jgi:hypothetical protein
MNAVERVLYEELTHLLDRVATSVPEGGLEQLRAGTPTLKTRLEELDSRLATLRGSLLDQYGRWTQALEDIENLWALAAWRSAAMEESTDKSSALAA